MKLKEQMSVCPRFGGIIYILVPFLCLLVSGLVGRPSVGEDETSERVTTLVGTMGVHLSSTVISLEVDLALINVTNDLNVVGGLHELNTSDRTSWDKAGTMARLGAPCNRFALDIANDTIGLGRTPHAPVCRCVSQWCCKQRLATHR